MAGLAAARQLQSFGMETVVLEARVSDRDRMYPHLFVTLTPLTVKMFLCSAVSSPRRFTIFPQSVHSDTNSTLGSILAMQQLCATTIYSHFHLRR